MPTTLYGPGDNYDPFVSHVLPALIRKFHEAKTRGSDRVTLWRDGSPWREFLYSDDLAAAVVFLMENRDAKDLGDFVNLGTGVDQTIKDLAHTVRDVVYADTGSQGALGCTCAIDWDTSKPNGTPKKLLDVSRLTALGWTAKTPFKEGIEKAYEDFKARYKV